MTPIYPLKKEKSDQTKLPYPHVLLFHWSPRNGSINFGDRLSEVVTRQLLKGYNLSLDDEVKESSRLLAIGSILHFAQSGDHIWGSGWNGKIPKSEFMANSLIVHAVRGPLTAEFLRKKRINVPEVFGDPGLLIPDLFKGRFKPKKELDYVFVPNLNDLSLVSGWKNIVSPLWGWNSVISEIMRSKLVLSSSLHGLIIAEAFGIPARYVRISETESLFKYQDYYLGTGRMESDFNFAKSIDEGMEMGGVKSLQFDPEDLINAFPLELWSEPRSRISL